MNKKLFIGGLPYSTTEDALQAYFSDAGDVASVSIITDRDTGRSKGFGFVEMETDEGAQAAIDKFHDQEFEGRRLTVNEARPPRAPGSGGGGGGRRFQDSGSRW